MILDLSIAPVLRSLAQTFVDMTTPLTITPSGPAAQACCAPAVGIDAGLDVDRITAIARALADPLRVRVLDVLRRSERDVCQCELVALFGVQQSLLSHHVNKLVDAGLVTVERRHRWAYYSLSDNALEELITWLT